MLRISDRSGRRGAPNTTAGDPLRQAVTRVVETDNCSGCGACTLLSPSLTMQLDPAGFLRPHWADGAAPGTAAALPAAAAAATFRRICPGVSVRAAATSGRRHPTLGAYVSVWSAWSADPAIRHAGSSGGVLTALSTWLLDTGRASTVVGAGSSLGGTTRSAARRLGTPSAVLQAAGSRYAPTANAALFDSDPHTAFIGKPCEVSAVRRLGRPTDRPPAADPVLLSFFCAGTPSQRATDALVSDLGLVPADVRDLRYRGNGWPGRFTATDSAGRTVSTSYENSWGAHLGKNLQNRCKICPDGTGTHADISVGDYWDADPNGYPLFVEGGGRSVAIARTERGHTLLLEARGAGVLVLEPIDIARVAAVQPLQDQRVRTLVGRLAGRRFAGMPVPRFRGFGLVGLAARNPRENLRFLRGSYRRSKTGRG